MKTIEFRISEFFLFVAFSFFAASSPVHANYQWAPYPPGVGGPWGGSARKIISVDGALWAATGAGVYYSSDNGATWEGRNNGLSHLNATDLDSCVPPDSTVPTLVATTMVDGFHNSSDLFFISKDGGDAWESASYSPWSGMDLWRVAVDPTNCDHIFVSSSSDGSYNEWALFESSNGGVSWRTVRSLPVTRMDFTSDGTLFFSTNALNMGGGYVYSCAGVYCSPINRWHPGQHVGDVAVGGPAGQEIIVASADSEGLFVSENGGLDWVGIYDPGELGYVQEVAVDPVDSSRIVFSVLEDSDRLYSIDLDSSIAVEIETPDNSAISYIFLTGGAEWFCGEGTGIFKRSNGESVFKTSNVGITAAGVLSFDFAADDPRVLAVGWQGGLSVWDPLSEVWTVSADGLPSNIPVELVKHLGNRVWAGVSGQGLHVSNDRGASWEKKFSGVSVSAGKHVESLVVMKDDPNKILAGTGVGIYKTVDGGGLWTPDEQIYEKFDWRISVDSLGNLFAGNRAGQLGLFYYKEKWTDQWIPRGEAFLSRSGTQIISLRASSTVHGHLLAGTMNEGILESLDYGETWKAIGNGQLDAESYGVKITDIALPDIANIDDRFAAVVKNTREVYVTVDGGAAWSLVMDGLKLPEEPMPFVEALSFAPGATRLVAGISNRGLWYVDLIFFGTNPVSSPTKSNVQTVSGVCKTGEVVDVIVTPPGNSYSLPCENEAWTVDLLDLSEGENTIAASMEDNGAVSTIVSTIVVDTTPPTAVFFDLIKRPSNQTTQTITGVKEAGSLLSATIEPVVDSLVVSAALESEVWEIEISGLQEGISILTIVAEDEVGNMSDESLLEIEVDVTPPRLTADDVDILTQQGSRLISGTLDDEESFVEFQAAADIVGFSYDPVSGDWSASVENLSEGENAVIATAIDGAGNSSIPVGIRITVDSIPPEFTVNQLNIEAVSRSQIISGTVEVGAEVQLDLGETGVFSNSIEYNGNSWSVLLKNLSDGLHEILLSATDSAGNLSSRFVASITVALIDSTPPLFSVDDVDLVAVSRSQTISGIVEPGGEVVLDLVDLGAMGASSNSVEYGDSGAWSVLVKNIPNGDHAVTVFAVDAVGNETSPVEIKIKVFLDETPPEVAVNRRNVLTEKFSWEISGTVSVEDDVCETVVLTSNSPASIGPLACDSAGGGWTVLVEGLTLGENIITVEAIDGVGNEAQPIDVVIYVLGEDPAVVLPEMETVGKFARILTGTVLNGIYLTVEAENAGSGIIVGQVEYNRDNGTWRVLVENLPVGENVFAVVAADAAGNQWDPMELTVKVETDPNKNGGGGGGGCFFGSLGF